MGQMLLKNLPDNKMSSNCKIFSVLVAVLPVLASYASGIPGFSVADICLAVFVGLAMLHRNDINTYTVRINPLILGLSVLIAFSILACAAGFPTSVSDVLIRTIRYTFYMIVLFTASKKFLHIQTLSDAVKKVAFWGSVFIIFQFIMYNMLGIVVKGHLSFLKLYTEAYGTMNYERIYARMYRPTSFFLEPAHYARYCILGLVLYLFGEDTVSKESLYRSAICAVGIVISTSSQGYFLLSVLVSMFFLTRIKVVKSRTLRGLLKVALLASPILVFYVLQLPVVSETIERTFGGSITNSNSALGGRLGGFAAYLELPFINKLLGTGFGNIPEDVWLSSAAYWLYGSGIIVFLIYVYFLVQSFLLLDRKGRYILFIVMFLFITDDSFYSYMIVLYFSMILFKPKLIPQGAENEYTLYRNRTQFS